MALTEKPSRLLPGGKARGADLSHRLAHLRTTLAPLVSVTDLTTHPDFPATLLHFYLLTSPQLDALAEHYHQRSPRVESWGYPISVVGRWAVRSGGLSSDGLSSGTPALPGTTATSSSALDISAAIMGLEPSDRKTGSGHGQGASGKATLADRRRRFGRFIGLRGCESPTLSLQEAMREEERCVELWFEREVMRRAEQERGPKGFMF